MREWSLNAWRTVKNEPIENEEAWRALYQKMRELQHQFHFVHLKGESRYSKEIQEGIQQVREKGQYYQQTELIPETGKGGNKKDESNRSEQL